MNPTVLEKRIAVRVALGVLVISLFTFGAPSPTVAQYVPSQTPNVPPFFAIQNVRIVTGAGAAIENGTVVIANGLIESVGADVSIPGDAWVIDGAGLTVYPGLFNALTQVGLEADSDDGPPGGGGNPFAQFAGQGPVPDGPEDRPGTTPWMDAADMLDPESDAIERWREGGFTNAMVAPDEGIVTGTGAVINYDGDAQQMVIKTPAALRLTLSPSGGFRAFPSSMMGVIAYLKQLYLDAGHQNTYAAAYAANPRGQPRPMYDRALGPVQDAIAAGWPTILPANDVKGMRRVIKLGRDTGARPVVAGAQDAYEIADELAAAGVPVLVDLDWPEENKNADPEAEETLESLKRRAYAPTTPAALEDAGVTWAFYSGSASSPRSVMENVRVAMENGLSEDAALRALTAGPAQIYGVDGVLGSIEAGKIANLVVTDGALFDEDTEIRMVFVDGHKYEETKEERPTTPPAVDVTGSWLLSLNDDSQEATADLEMTEDGTISGTIEGERGEQQITDGWVSGNEFRIVAIGSMGPGGEIEVIYTGTIDGDEMSGTASFGGRFNMDFTGSRPGGTR